MRTLVAEEEPGGMSATVMLQRACKGLGESQMNNSVDGVCSIQGVVISLYWYFQANLG